MKKLLTAVSAAALFANTAIAPAFANSLKSQTELETEYQMVLPEGEMMSDAELAEIEGEWVWVAINAGLEVGFEYADCRISSPGQCGLQENWRKYALAGTKGAVTGLIPGGGVAKGAAKGATRFFRAKKGVNFFQNGERINGLRVFVR